MEKDYIGLDENVYDAQTADSQLTSLDRKRAEMADKKSRNEASANSVRNIAKVAEKTKIPEVQAAAQVVNKLDKLTGSKSSELIGKAVEHELKHKPFGGLAQKAFRKIGEMGSNNSSKLPSEKSKKQKDSEAEAKAFDSGSFNVFFKSSSLFKLGLFCSIGCCIFMLFIIQLAIIADNEGASIVMGDMASEDRDMIKDIHDEVGQGNPVSDLDVGQGNNVLDSDVGMGSSNVISEYEERFASLGNVFSSENIKCEGKECLTRPEYRYYLKVADIAYRYKKKYNIKLDWVLLNATAQYNDMTQEAIMSKHVHDYDLDAVEDLNKLMDLDWDYDYKNINDYTYLDPDDYRYDLQILAKNMVAKTTTQQCRKVNKDESGKVHIKITKERKDQDVEDKYFKPGGEYYLKCAAGEQYSISSLYELDLKKYDEFLLEYIEHKFYLGQSNNGSEYIFPLPEGSTSCRSSAYGYRVHPITGVKHYHSGDDYPAAGGTSVYAVADGVVTAAGENCKVGNLECNSGMGNYVIIDHGNGISSVYMHATKVYVTSGETVKQGDVIMTVGTTGSSTGNHLHITFKKNGVKDDPANYIGALPMC